MQTKTIKLGPWGQTIIFVKGCTYEEASERFTPGYKIPDGTCNGVTMFSSMGEDAIIAVWVKGSIAKDHIQRSAVLAHECVHAANLAFTTHGYKPSPDNDEIIAYTVETLVREGTKFYTRKNTRRKK